MVLNFFKTALFALCMTMLASLTAFTSGHAAELIMLEQDACPWCERWHEEVGGIYSKTDEGQIAPLRIVNIHDKWPEDLENIRKERFTPTFILIEDGKEIDRLRGYTGDEFFWFLIGEMLKKLPDSNDSNG